MVMRTTARDFRRLKVWQKSHAVALEVYRLTACFPKSQLYSLTSQMQRAAISIASNIAEGCGRRGETELARFMTIAQGSAAELDYLALLASELGYIAPHAADPLAARITEINRMLAAYVTKLQA